MGRRCDTLFGPERRLMIESGSQTPGISAHDFGLPPGTALRYEQPDPTLRHLFPSYVVLDSEAVHPQPPPAWQLPTWAQIWIVLTDGPITVRIGNRRYDPLGSTILMGVTSRAMPTTAHGGVSIVIDVSPLGWVRLFGPSAQKLCDRITPLGELLPAAWIDELVTSLHASDRARDVKGVLDDWLLRHLPPPGRDEPIVAKIVALLADQSVTDLAGAAEAAGIGIRSLRRLTKRYFGFPPKLLMIRTRFMAVLVSMMLDETRKGAVPAMYHDAPHFNRDGRRFLGMTPRRFLALPSPYTVAALRARKLVIGQGLAILDPACSLS
jgi:hypothetical protein